MLGGLSFKIEQRYKPPNREVSRISFFKILSATHLKSIAKTHLKNRPSKRLTNGIEVDILPMAPPPRGESVILPDYSHLKKWLPGGYVRSPLA